MRIFATVLVILGVAFFAHGETLEKRPEEEGQDFVACFNEDETLDCLGRKFVKEYGLDDADVGKEGLLSLYEGLKTDIKEVIGGEGAEETKEVENEAEGEEKVAEGRSGIEEARKKKFGKKKSKQLKKIFSLLMLFKTKISLLLQFISTHFQLKFFVIAIISLILNAAKFWLDLKKSHPQKVIYYEHAQHQHHYDHDEHDPSYWGRSADESPQNLAYSAYAARK